MRIGLTDYDDEILVTGMALELLLLEDPSDFSEKTPVILLISNFDGRIDQIKHSVNNYIDKCHGGQKTSSRCLAYINIVEQTIPRTSYYNVISG